MLNWPPSEFFQSQKIVFENLIFIFSNKNNFLQLVTKKFYAIDCQAWDWFSNFASGCIFQINVKTHLSYALLENLYPCQIY